MFIGHRSYKKIMSDKIRKTSGYITEYSYLIGRVIAYLLLNIMSIDIMVAGMMGCVGVLLVNIFMFKVAYDML